MLNEFLAGRLGSGNYQLGEKQNWSDSVSKEKSEVLFKCTKEHRSLSYVNYDLVEKHHEVKVHRGK